MQRLLQLVYSPKDKLSTSNSIMKRQMRQSKINFFQSPHPQHFDPLCHQHFIYTTLDLADCHEDHLFHSPARASCSPQNEIYNIEYQQISTQPQKQTKVDSFLDNSGPVIEEERETPQIHQKIDFSDEEDDLLLVLTPQRQPILPEESQSILDNNTTVRKNNHISMSTPTSDPRLCERGLKRLAHQAFLFVTNQKKTTYKQVARKLIGQINEDCELQAERKGQMNIKRRVYDALNVLIALGLLKRNGNKILAKKVEDKINFDLNNSPPHLIRAESQEEELFEQRQYLMRVMKEKQEIIDEKKKLLNSLQKKAQAIRQLHNRNKAVNPSQKIAKIEMPFIVVSSRETQTSLNSQQQLSLWQEDSNTFHMTFPQERLKLQGDLDVLQEMEKPTVKPEKFRRNRRV